MIEVESKKVEVDSHYLFKFAKTAFGTLTLEVDNTQNISAIEVAIGETLTPAGVLNPTPHGNLIYFKATLALKAGLNTILFPIPEHVAPNPKLTKCPTPAEASGEITPFRYVQIDNFSGTVTVIRHGFFGDWDDNNSHFYSSDHRINELWDFCKYSIKATSGFDKYVDGQRERLPYEGDLYINQLSHFCCSPTFKLARTSLNHLFKHPTWPTEWRLLMPIMVRDLQLYSGENVDDLIVQFNLLEKYINADGLVQPNLISQDNFDVEKDIRDIVDWPMNERDNYEFGDVNLVPNAYLYGMYKALYELTGDNQYVEKRNALRGTIRRLMLKEGHIVDNPNSNHTSIHSAIFALFFDLLDETEVSFHKAVIRERKMACSVYVAQFLLETCYKYDMSDYALELMRDDSIRSWRNMINCGATISMEAWDDRFKANQDWSHPWGAAPANIIPRYLCGLQPLENGFTKVLIDPQPADLDYFYYRVKHQIGEFIIEYKDGKLNYSAPENCQVTLGSRWQNS